MNAEAGPHIFLVAGEESGDRLGASLIAALRRATEGRVRFTGVGGAHMAEAGVPSLFPLGDLAIVGFAAIFANLPKIFRRIREAADAVIAANPDVLVIIDSPEFTHRVARRVRRRAPHIPIVDYVCPSVWAWRPGRARAMRAYVDRVLALLPFEPAAMARLNGPPTTYVGHPLGEQADRLRNPDPAARLSGPLLVLPGSRSAEIRRLAPAFGVALGIVSRETPGLEVVVLAVPRLESLVREATAGWPVPVRIVTDQQEKEAAFRAARAALSKSGTSTLELAVAGIPMITAYKVPFIEEVVARLLIVLPSVILANIILDELVVPEFLQREGSPERLAAALTPLLADTPERRRQVEAFTRLDRIMEIGTAVPSERATAAVLEMVRRPLTTGTCKSGQ